MDSESKFGRIARIVACVVLIFGAIGAALLGPGAQIAASRVRANPEAPGAPEQLLSCAKARRLVGDAVDYKRLLELWIEFFAREQGRDWEPLLAGEQVWSCSKTVWTRSNLDVDAEGIEVEGFTPWLFARGRPPARQAAKDTLTGEVLLLYVDLLEEEKEYDQARRVLICLLNLWPETSPVHKRAVEVTKRANPSGWTKR